MAPLASLLDQLTSNTWYYPCLLLVHEEIGRLQAMAMEMADELGKAPLDVGLLLSGALLTLPARRRTSQVQTVLLNALAAHQPGPVLCSEIDLLFEPTLQLDPLALLRTCSRQVPLLVLWPGGWRDQVLSYAVPAHAHFRTWSQTGLRPECVYRLP